MESKQTSRIIELITLLTTGGSHSAQQCAETLGVTRRNVYNYMRLLADCGFNVRHDTGGYSLDPRSAFFRRLKENIPLSEAEAEYICHALADTEQTDRMAAHVRAKLARHFGLDDGLTGTELTQRISTCKATLRLAMRTERIAKIIGYSSPHSHTVSDRYVEPYMFLNNGRDVRCHEIATHLNKTFKLARMTDVELIDDQWFNKPLHKKVYTDIFMFSGEERHTISLRLGLLSRNLMAEEYPLAEPSLMPETDGRHWNMDIEVASLLGIGRFVLGLYDDIEVLGDDDFKEYIRNKIKAMKHTLP